MKKPPVTPVSADSAPPAFVSSKRQLAKACGVTAAAVQAWDIRPGFPGKTENGYDVQAIQAWRSGNLQPDRAARSHEAAGDQARLLKAQADEREAKAALAELELKIQRGEYLPIAEVKQRDVARIAAVKRGLLALERSLPPRLVGLQEKEMHPVVRGICRELLTRFQHMSQ